MTDVVTKAALTPARKRLVELMQEVNYGRIEGLRVQNGEPVFDPPPTVLRLFLFGKDNGPNESRGNDGFALKKKVAELFEVFDREARIFIFSPFVVVFGTTAGGGATGSGVVNGEAISGAGAVVA